MIFAYILRQFWQKEKWVGHSEKDRMQNKKISRRQTKIAIPPYSLASRTEI
jgi:hypothetical protein